MKNFDIFVDEADLRNAMALGRMSSDGKGLRNMVNRLLESMFSREFMATHTLSGRKAPVPSKKTLGTKPMLPLEAVKCLCGNDHSQHTPDLIH
jgi:hypothetical protein